MKKLLVLLLAISSCAVHVTSKPPVGAVIPSMLSESQYQTAVSPDCVLADGRSVAGSKYAAITGSSTIPDIRGEHLRGKNNGRSDGKEDDIAGEVALGTYEGSFVKNHNHIWWSVNGGGTVQTYDSAGSTVNYPFYTGASSTVPALSSANAQSANFALYTSPVIGEALGTGNGENSVKSVVVNYFICIN